MGAVRQDERRKRHSKIRKAGKKRAAERAAALEALDEEAVEAEPEKGPGKGHSRSGFRLRPDQVAKKLAGMAEARQAWDAIYIEATAAWADLYMKGLTGRGEVSADGVAAKYASRVPEGYTLTGRMLKNALSQGRSGVAQRKPGPQAAIPTEFVEALSSYAQLKQVGGEEQTPRMLTRVAVAAVSGTDMEEALSTNSKRMHLMTRVRQLGGMQTLSTCVIDDRRWTWLTAANLTQWFEGYKRALFEAGFIDEIPDDVFDIITIDPRKAARMANGDETHQKLSNEGEARGPRSNVYVNPLLGRAGKRKVVFQKHATFLAWVCYDGQVGAPHMILATDAAAAKKGTDASQEAIDAIRMNHEWTFGVPRVIGKFGCAEEQTWEPTFIMTEKGGMESGGLEQFMAANVLPKFPNISKTWEFDDEGNVVRGPVFFQLDAGPDRLTEASLPFRTAAWERGLILFPGLPNGTSANQVCDDLFGPYKTGCDQQADDIVAERLAAASTSTTSAKLDFCDLGRIMNGRDGDPISARPFERAFTREKILRSVERLGLNPIDLGKALAHKKVRDDSETGTRSDAINSVRQAHDDKINKLADKGFAIEGLLVAAPKELRRFVAPPSTQEEQWKAMKEGGASIGTMWQAVGAKAFNAPAVTGPAMERAQEKLLETNEKKARQLSDFTQLQAQANDIHTRMLRDDLEYDDLSAGDLKLLVSFCHRAQKKLGVGEHSKNRAASEAYLNSLEAGVLEELLLSPPALEQLTSAAAAQAPVVAVAMAEDAAGSPLQLKGPAHMLSFGKHECEMPEERLSPVTAPPWLEAACAPGSASAEELVGMYILYKWPPRLGGWAVGKIMSVQLDPKITVKKVQCNFTVFYECDQQSADHYLSLAMYASSAKAPSDSWVLLGS